MEICLDPYSSLLLSCMRGCDSFDLDADQEPVSKPTLSIPIAMISGVKWPVRPDHLDKRSRICCFSVESEGTEHIFAAANKAWYVPKVETICPYESIRWCAVDTNSLILHR